MNASVQTSVENSSHVRDDNEAEGTTPDSADTSMAAQVASSFRAGPTTVGATILSTTTDGVSHPPVGRGGSATSANSGGGTPQLLHTKCTVSDDLLAELWAICPAPNSYLLQVIRSKGINVAHIQLDDITKHDS